MWPTWYITKWCCEGFNSEWNIAALSWLLEFKVDAGMYLRARQLSHKSQTLPLHLVLLQPEEESSDFWSILRLVLLSLAYHSISYTWFLLREEGKLTSNPSFLFSCIAQYHCVFCGFFPWKRGTFDLPWGFHCLADSLVHPPFLNTKRGGREGLWLCTF